MKQSGTLTKITTKEEVGIEKSICHLGFNFIGVIKQPICPPIMMTILMLWSIKINYYKEQAWSQQWGNTNLKLCHFL
jgi:hypothetical protein